MTSNPFADGYVPPVEQDEAAPITEREDEPSVALISEPGAYPDIDGDRYHAEEICSAPSISSTGLKTIEGKSPYHFWYGSNLNPKRVPQEQKPHFNIGKGVHDLLLLQGLFPRNYFILPEGFDARLKKYADVRDERDAAMVEGIPVLTFEQYHMVQAMAAQVEQDELAKALLISGTPEMTVIAKDPVTGVFMRARPDVLPDTMDIVPDIKTTRSAHPSAFQRQATQVGYFQSAAHYIDCIDLVFGEPDKKRRFVLIAVEKDPPHLVQIYQLDDEAIQMGRMLNRRALNIFAEGLRTGFWAGYSTPERPILPLELTGWAFKEINERIERDELSWEQ